MSFSDMARSMMKNNRANLKSKRGKFKFTKMLPKSSLKPRSLGSFLKSKRDYAKKVKKDEINHWTRVVGLSLVVAAILVLLYYFG